MINSAAGGENVSWGRRTCWGKMAQECEPGKGRWCRGNRICYEIRTGWRELVRTIFSALAPRNNKNEEKKFRRGEASREKIQAATDHGGRAADGAVEKPPKVRWKSGTFSAALALLHNHRALAPVEPGPSSIHRLLKNTDTRLDAVPAVPARDSSVCNRDGVHNHPNRGCDDS